MYRNHFYIDKRSFTLFRVLIGLVLIHDFGVRLSDYQAHYSNAGVLPQSAWMQYFQDAGLWSLLIVSSNDVYGVLVFVAGLLAAATLLLGYRPRLMSFICWVLLVSVQNRNPLLYQGGDDLLRMSLFWTMFINPRADTSPEKPVQISSFATMALLLQSLFPFLFSGLWKGVYEWWVQGTALNYALQLDQLTRYPGLWLRQYPAITEWLTRLAYIFELMVLPLFLLPFQREQMRMVVFFLLLSFSTGLILFFMIGLFPICILACASLFLPTAFWEKTKFRGAFAKAAPHRPPSLVAWWGKRFVLSFCFLLVCWWNLADIPKRSLQFPDAMRTAMNVLKLNQSWGVFAPSVIKEDGWLVLQATLQNGEAIDLNNNYRKPNYNKPAYVLARYKNDRWRKYTEQIFMRYHEHFRPYFAQYLVQQYNNEVAADAAHKIKSLKIYYMLEVTPVDKSVPKVKKVLIYEY